MSANEGKPVRLVRTLSAVAMIAVAGMSLTACSLFDGDSRPGPTDGATTAATPTPEAIFVPDGGAEENKAYFDKTLQDLLDANPEAGSHEMVNALTEAGFDKSQMEVTPDKTAVDLDAAFVVVSVKMPDNMCLIGQTGTHGYASMVAEPMKSTDTCLIGKNQEIDW
ncbi:DUF6993 domain-containing protein [Gulosibacter chungangensis]|uniref:DUF6993 domain-containing protein n=1 Tax=Gulosibacter chungangensis TaxID=979746 RepID=A0A7J5BAB5_9MICO|nr:hypothetical protein [Gulosibacter chungangensis]KAB1642725.1 hypothetical protein F8O05_09725 [Gulosibacter chungangensis]